MSNCADKKKQRKKTGGPVKGRQAITKEGEKDKCCELNQQSLINTMKLGTIEMETQTTSMDGEGGTGKIKNKINTKIHETK